MHILTKKTVFNVLLLNSSIMFGMMPYNDDQKICNDIVVYFACNLDAKGKNALQKVNKQYNTQISKKNDNFLMILNPNVVSKIDKETIWLTTKNKTIKDRFKPLYIEMRSYDPDNNDDFYANNVDGIRRYISLDYFNDANLLINNCNITLNNNNITTIPKMIDLALSLNIEICKINYHTGGKALAIPISKSTSLDANEQKRVITEFLHIACLLNNEYAISLFSLLLSTKYINNTLFLKKRQTTTGMLLQESMRRNNKEAFISIINNDPFCIFNESYVLASDVRKLLESTKDVHDTRKELFCEIHDQEINKFNNKQNSHK